MPRHSAVPQEKRTLAISSFEQHNILKEMKEFLTECKSVLKKSFVAKVPCKMCLSGKPMKLNAEGKCLSCDGVDVIDDHDRQKWAFEQVYGRFCPMPKSVEMRLEDNRDKEELAPGIESIKDPAKVDEMLRMMDQAVGSDLTVVGIDESAGNEPNAQE